MYVESTIKGKSDGRITEKQICNPFVTPTVTAFGILNIKIKLNIIKKI
jgi:hypothetical protein